MIPAQPVQVIINVLMLLFAGWLVKLGLDDGSAAALAGAVGAIVVAVVLSLLQRKKLLETPPPTPTPAPTDTRDDIGRRLPAILLPLLIGLAIFAPGCQSIDRVSVEADRARFEAIELLVIEHVDRHPDQAQTWTNFLTTWRNSIESRSKIAE